jgi:hypothetical protein
MGYQSAELALTSDALTSFFKLFKYVRTAYSMALAILPRRQGVMASGTYRRISHSITTNPCTKSPRLWSLLLLLVSVVNLLKSHQCSCPCHCSSSPFGIVCIFVERVRCTKRVQYGYRVIYWRTTTSNRQYMRASSTCMTSSLGSSKKIVY